MTDKHTPGPLIAKQIAGGRYWVICDERGIQVGQTFSWYGKPAEANARLWAASVDLLAVLQSVEWTHSECFWCGMVEDQGHAADCARQAAIAKAQGFEQGQ